MTLGLDQEPVSDPDEGSTDDGGDEAAGADTAPSEEPGAPSEETAEGTEEPEETAQAGQAVVRAGESLADVAARHGVDADSLLGANVGDLDRAARARGFDGSKGGQVLFVGHVLTLPPVADGE